VLASPLRFVHSPALVHTNVAIVPSTYTPPQFLDGGHRQTLYASLVRRVDFAYDRRERIETPDNDFLDLDWATPPTDTRRIAILTHGLEGSANRRYMRGMARAFVRRGWAVCALNLRGCSGEINRQVATYHSGKTDDLALVVDHVITQNYDSVALVGFSLGGNLTLKYLGERGPHLDDRIRGAVALSAPVDLSASADQIDRWSNAHYTQYFLHSLRRKMQAKARQHPDRVSTDQLWTIVTLRGFDDAYTAPLHGFTDAEGYYRRASSKPLLPDLPVPTLLLNAANDPFLPPACYPYAIARDHARLTLEVPASGGHVGFVSFSDRGEYWSEHRTTSFLNHL
jgi:predicted alpha/beta-fold hydrolase